MAIRLDPEQTETELLLNFTESLAGRRVLEIGSGDGRLTWRYAEQARHVTGLEPDEHRYHHAKVSLPEALQDRVMFHHASLQTFGQREDLPAFDLAILSWSL